MGPLPTGKVTTRAGTVKPLPGCLANVIDVAGLLSQMVSQRQEPNAAPSYRGALISKSNHSVCRLENGRE